MRVPVEALQRFVEEALSAAGADRREAPVIASALIWSDLIGRGNHGVWRLPAYLKRLQRGLIVSPCEPASTRPAPAVVLVDGRGGFGHYVGHVAMTRAIEVAAEQGIGVAAVRDSNHFGVGAYFVELACARHMIGLATSNSVPKVAPWGGAQAMLGTNPFAFGAPRANGRSILVDFATAASAGSAIIKARETGEAIPDGIAIDEQGHFINDPRRIGEGALLPFGGAKGFGLGLFVEILSAVITGAAMSHGVASMFENWERRGGNGHLFIAVDLAALLPLESYYERIEGLCAGITGARRQAGVEEILMPGERRWRAIDDQRAHGIDLEPRTIDALSETAAELGIPPLI
jgi:LDH2 family malate/lactate/ureidoglycolate dehydrogenase